MYTGPKLTNEDLVFGYDTGYGVADNNTATRFYPGENTVNLLNYDTTMPKWPSNSSNMASLTSKTSARSFTVIGTCNVPGSMVFVYPSISANTAYHTISATFTNNSTETSNVALYIRGLNNATSTVNQSQTTTIQPGESIRKTLIGNVLTANNGYTAAVGVWSHGTSGQVNMNVTDVQFEEKTHATPFVDGTRSSTQSLIDLKRTTDIDVANASFDANAQPDFDGTDDYIELGSALNSIGHVASFEMVFKATETIDNYRIMLGWGHGNNNYSGIHIGSWTSGYTDESFHVAFDASSTQIYVRKGHSYYKDNAFHHAVVTAGSGNYKIWIDGVDETDTVIGGTNMFNEIVGYNSNITTQIGRRPYGGGSGYFKGEIPVMKVYNKILTETEIKSNFKAYKNRFNI